MNSLVSKIILSCNSKKEKLNILVSPFVLETEKEICKTGHNFYRINNQEDNNLEGLPENLFILPKEVLPLAFDYDLFIARDGTLSDDMLGQIVNAIQTPVIIITDRTDEHNNNPNLILSDLYDHTKEDFVKQWTKLLENFTR